MRSMVNVFGALMMVGVILATPVLADSDKNERKRAEIDATADGILKELFTSSEHAKGIYDKSVGHAVFSNLKVQFVISGGGGNGVAVTKEGKRTYMNMGTAGIGLGIGAKKYHVVFFFETEKSMTSFVEKGWQADASAQAEAGEAGVDAAGSFKQGIAYYQLNDKGLIASADITGTKYWKSGDLNEKPAEKASEKAPEKEETSEEKAEG